MNGRVGMNEVARRGWRKGWPGLGNGVGPLAAF